MNGAKLGADFLHKYGFVDKLPLPPFNVNTFRQICIEDPFPDDDKVVKGSLDDVDDSIFKVPNDVGDLIYGKSRFLKHMSPWQVYIPRKEIMFKIMRACIEVKEPNELWINKK